jgi:hypothetical protein
MAFQWPFMKKPARGGRVAQTVAELFAVRVVTATFYSELFLHSRCFGCATGVHDPAQHSIFNGVADDLLKFVALGNVVHRNFLIESDLN